MDDLFQTGVLGLIEALDKYNPDKGANFATVAGWYIQNSLRDNRFLVNKELSLDCPINEGEDISLKDMIEDENVDIEGNITSSLFLEHFKEEFRPLLTPIQYDAIILYYGFGGSTYTLQEIGEKYNKDGKYILGERNKALRIIRKEIVTKKLWVEINHNTSFIRGVDYTRPRVNRGRTSSPVEDLVVEREKMFNKRLGDVDNV